MRYIVNLSSAADSREIQEMIADTLPVPEHYGKNLDALYDVLTSWNEPFEIIFLDSSNTFAAVNDDGACHAKKEARRNKDVQRLRKVCEDARKENKNMSFSFVNIDDCETDDV